MSSLVRRIQRNAQRFDTWEKREGCKLGCKPLLTDYRNSAPARGSRRGTRKFKNGKTVSIKVDYAATDKLNAQLTTLWENDGGAQA